jgi:hypothetical protein
VRRHPFVCVALAPEAAEPTLLLMPAEKDRHMKPVHLTTLALGCGVLLMMGGAFASAAALQNQAATDTSASTQSQ